jgi:nucleoside phosphorylase
VAVDLLVLAAFDPELAPLRSLLGPGLAARLGARTVVARTAGIGLLAAAAGAAAQLAELAPRAVVLIGSCGTYVRAGLGIGDVVVARRLRLVDLASLDGLAQFPSPMVTDFETDASLRGGLAAAAPGDALRPASWDAACVATTLAITVDDAAAESIALRTGAHVEHLEAHGVATACAPSRTPFAAVLGVANFVGSRGRAEWLAHHVRAEAAAGERLVRWLREGA